MFSAEELLKHKPDVVLSDLSATRHFIRTLATL
jgi:hypothetical protein